ncbi:hypothetical protein FAM22279_01023 [Lacticaseibacillus paracasei]|nr:hypothetical protein FAM22279_01023 [Lacticaseibacillus paracasei]
MDKIISIIIVILILLATIAFYLAPFVGGLWQGAARSKVIAKILLLNRDLKLSSKGLSRLINPQNPYIVAVELGHHIFDPCSKFVANLIGLTLEFSQN